MNDNIKLKHRGKKREKRKKGKKTKNTIIIFFNR